MTQIFALNLASLNIGRFFRLGFFLWLLAELVVFFSVASAIGLGHAMLLGLASTTFGIILLFRFGRTAAMDLSDLMNGGLTGRKSSAFDKTLTATAIALLILPGFLSDLIGLALLLPPVRSWIAARVSPKAAFSAQREESAEDTFGPRHRTAPSSDIIDLPAGEWRRVDDPRS